MLEAGKKGDFDKSLNDRYRIKLSLRSISAGMFLIIEPSLNYLFYELWVDHVHANPFL